MGNPLLRFDSLVMCNRIGSVRQQFTFFSLSFPNPG